jgi:Carboxypeptidase regulatory-like domain
MRAALCGSLIAGSLIATTAAQDSRPPLPTGIGSISGVVLDANNQPVPGAEVRALIALTRDGVRQLVSTGPTATTDATGTYHLTGRQPGTYQIVAVSYSSTPGAGLNTPARLPAATVNVDGTKVAYVTTYFPAASEPAGAQPLEEVILTPAPNVRVSGSLQLEGITATPIRANFMGEVAEAKSTRYQITGTP